MFAWRIAAVALAAGLAVFSAAGDDKKSGEPKADFTGWLKHGKPVVGVVEKSDYKGLFLKVMTGVSGNRPRYEQLQFMLHDAGLVRWKKLPAKTDDKGKRSPYTSEELADLKSPRGAPGFAADTDDLQPGYLVELTLVRPKEIPASKVVFQDLRVQYAVILTEDKSASAGGKKDDEKKPEKKSNEKKPDEKKPEKKPDDKNG